MATKKIVKLAAESASAEPAKSAAPATKKPAKKAVKKVAAKKAAPKAAAQAAPKAQPGAVAAPTPDALARAAYLNYRRRVEQGLPGDSHGDWLEAERYFSRTSEA